MDVMTIEFEIEGPGDVTIRALFARIGDPTPVLADVGEFKRRQILRSMPRMARAQRSTPGVPPAKRSGLLSQRITYSVEGERLDVGTNDVRARMLQYGGMIRPRNAKALAVPVHRDAYGKRPRDFENLVIIPRKKAGKPPLLIRKIEGGPKGKKTIKREDIMFVLLPYVIIRPRPFLLWRQPQDAEYVVKSLQRHVEAH